MACDRRRSNRGSLDFRHVTAWPGPVPAMLGELLSESDQP